MADKFIIIGKKPLKGEVNIGGSKNAAGPCLIACLLTDKECMIDNLPLIEDIFILLEIFKSMGVQVEWVGERKVKIQAKEIDASKIDFEKVSQIRMSVLLFAPLLTRIKNFKISAPGGDRIGVRPISTHLEVLEEFGASVRRENNFYIVNCESLKPAEIILEEFSVTATEIAIMIASLIEGKTIIKGAAAEPHVQDLIKMLKNMGAKIEEKGSHVLEIEGVRDLNGVDHSLIFDGIEAATFIAIGAGTPGSEIVIKNLDINYLNLFLKKLKKIGVKFELKNNNEIKVFYSPNLQGTKIQALPYPGFPTDFLPLTVPLLVRAKGKSLIHDPLYENRFSYVQELRKMGADVEIVDPHRAIIFGERELVGTKIESLDIRSGAGLVISSLMAEGETIIENIFQIDRGYEKIEEKLQKLGAYIFRLKK